MKRSLQVETQDASCYFRTSVTDGSRKALVQITERCNLHCAHCFVSSTSQGLDMSLEDIRDKVIPRLLSAGVERVTLTGGEPFVHPEILEICRSFVEGGLPLGLCTNATQTSDDQIRQLVDLGSVHMNVSFDGFRAETHGLFRGDRSSFELTKLTTQKFADAGILQGLLSTPNVFTTPEEFADLCRFALDLGAEYLLMNPLSAMGRGVKSKARLQASSDLMAEIRSATARFAAEGIELVHIRFPNSDKPLAGCEAGRIIYVFTDGSTAVCPYLVFAARSPASRHADTEFLVGNILEEDLSRPLADYSFHDRYRVGDNPTCGACSMSDGCGKGCPAAVVANGESIGAVDREQCPVVGERELLPISVRAL